MIIKAAQLNPKVGDIEGNLKLLLSHIPHHMEADLIITPELFLTGYPPLDLLHHPKLYKEVEKALDKLIKASEEFPNTGLLVGCPLLTEKGATNSACLIVNGKHSGTYDKQLLPTYDVFDEKRYFIPGENKAPLPFKGKKLGVHICEDAWIYDSLTKTDQNYSVSPIQSLIEQGASCLINLSASPYQKQKVEQRHILSERICTSYSIPFYFINQMGGNDQLLFDGASFALNKKGELNSQAPSFEAGIFNLSTPEQLATPPESELESIRKALVMGIKDYVKKSGFKSVVIGLSGGIDSALTAALCVEALGSHAVYGVLMPSLYSSDGSISDAEKLAHNLNIQTATLPIKESVAELNKTLETGLGATLTDITEQNIQSRVRGLILMGYANQQNGLVITTGNKSEIAIGYCTLYGDMNGALAPLGDLYKTEVYALSEHLNINKEIIPSDTLTKPPSAELKPNQTDQDTLPDYSILDAILKGLIEDYADTDALIKAGHPEKWVKWVKTNLDRNEYKRFQGAPILKISAKSFGIGRRMPIAAKQV